MAKLTIDADLYEKLKRRAEAAGYSSVDELVRHVLEKEVAGMDVDSADIAKVKDRLKGLGYLA